MSADVSIRPFREEDIPELHQAVLESIDELRPWMPWCHPDYAISQTTEWIRRQIAAFPKGDAYEFAILSENRIAGGCGLNGIQRESKLANLGYWVRTSSSKRGVATKAVRLLVDWSFQHTDLERLEIAAAVRNIPSLRVAAKVGAVWEGVLRNSLMVHGVPQDAAHFSILRGER